MKKNKLFVQLLNFKRKKNSTGVVAMIRNFAGEPRAVGNRSRQRPVTKNK